MPVKDYYKILELPSNATLSEIKKNFRRLALRYHPDTNHGNEYADAWFEEIQEAYTVLSDPSLRDQYLQDRWLLKSQGKDFATSAPLTPALIVKQVQELQEQVKNIDHFRMNHEMLQQQILLAVTDEHLEVLKRYDEPDKNDVVVRMILHTLTTLDFPFIHPIIKQLEKIAGASLHQTIQHYHRTRKRNYIWEKYQGVILLVMTIIICLSIYLLGK